MKLKSITGSLLAVGALLLANPVSASFEITGDYINPPPPLDYDEDALRATVTCTGCEVLDYAGGDIVGASDLDPARPNSSDAAGFDDSSGNTFKNEFEGTDGLNAEEEEQAWVNAVLAQIGSSDTVDLGTKTNDPLDVNNQFCSDAEYILFKIGGNPEYTLVHNTGGELCFTYIAEEGTGSGLSHVVEYGGNGVSEPSILALFGAGLLGNGVSEPSILALFGAGLLVLGFLRRRTIV